MSRQWALLSWRLTGAAGRFPTGADSIWQPGRAARWAVYGFAHPSSPGLFSLKFVVAHKCNARNNNYSIISRCVALLICSGQSSQALSELEYPDSKAITFETCFTAVITCFTFKEVQHTHFPVVHWYLHPVTKFKTLYWISSSHIWKQMEKYQSRMDQNSHQILLEMFLFTFEISNFPNDLLG